MSMQELKQDLASHAKGLYQEIKTFNAENEANVQPLEYYAAKAKDDYGVYPEEAVLRRREEHYLRKFHVQPEEPLRDAAVRQYAHDTWVLEKHWAEMGCALHGPAAPTVEKAFTTTGLQGTFPIYFDAAITEGRLADSILNRLVTEIVPTNSGLANHVELADPASTSSALATLGSNNLHPLQQASETGEGARVTQVSIMARERQIPLKKFGYEALASYEALRRVRLPVFQRTLARIGRGFQILLTDFAMDVLVLGDGATLLSGTSTPSNAAATVPATVAGTPVYADYVNLDLAFPMGYDSVLWIMNREAMIKMLNVAEFKDPLAGFRFQNAGVLPMPFGHEIIRWDTTGQTTAWPNTATNCKILALDPAIGLIEYTEGGIITETDNIIDAGWQKVVSTTWVAFAMMDPQARVVMTGAA